MQKAIETSYYGGLAEMDAFLLAYTVLTGTVTAITAEEVRDWRYFPLIALSGFTVFGVIILFNPSLIPPAYRDFARIILSALTVFVVILFIKDLRKIVKIQRNSTLCLKHASEFSELKTALRLETEEFSRICNEKVTEMTMLADELWKSIEGLRNG
jgi:cytochrome c biogenesis protein CcdA